MILTRSQPNKVYFNKMMKKLENMKEKVANSIR